MDVNPTRRKFYQNKSSKTFNCVFISPQDILKVGKTLKIFSKIDLGYFDYFFVKI